jgi:hypothetical protein
MDPVHLVAGQQHDLPQRIERVGKPDLSSILLSAEGSLSSILSIDKETGSGT